jgi:hypothetical protein
MATRNIRRRFRIRTTPPEASTRFRNFVTLYGVNNLARDIEVDPKTVFEWKSGRALPCDWNKAKLRELAVAMLADAKPPYDIFGDGKPAVTGDDFMVAKRLEFRERAKQ